MKHRVLLNTAVFCQLNSAEFSGSVEFSKEINGVKSDMKVKCRKPGRWFRLGWGKQRLKTSQPQGTNPAQ